MKKKQRHAINRQTALKELAAFGGIASLLPLLSASADAAAKKPVTPASSNPMNLSYVVSGALSSRNAKTKAGMAPTQGTLTLLAWEDPASPQSADGTLIYSFDGDTFTADGKFNDRCLYDGKKKTGIFHIRVYFLAQKGKS